jgi:hypothetical protein
MITIRNEQKDALRMPLIIKQIRGLVEHVKTNFPDETAGETDDELFDRIKETLERAEKYDIRAERDVYKYINISMIYGADFDEKEETAWTVDYLNDEDVSSPTMRINRLYEEILYRLEVEENNARIEEKFYGDTGEKAEEEDWSDDMGDNEDEDDGSEDS